MNNLATHVIENAYGIKDYLLIDEHIEFIRVPRKRILLII